MKKKTILIALCFLASLSTFEAQIVKKVLLIGIDGCRSDALIIAETPNIDGLISNGIYSPNALNDDITISGPGWSAILCGVWSEKHLVTGNNFTINNYDTYPSFFKHAEDANPAINTLSICHWAPINDAIVQDDADFKLNVNSDAEVSSQAASYISSNDPDLIFLHYDDVDHAGHGSGFDPNNITYIEAIEIVDGLLLPVLQAIEQRPNYSNEDWLILVTSDHGGVGTSHGGTSIEHQEVAFIASGNSVEQAVIKKDSTQVSNTTTNCISEFSELTFDSNDDYVSVPSNPLLDFGATQDFTIECRVRTSNAGDIAMIGNKDWDSGNYPGFIFSFKLPNGPEWKVNIGDGNSRADLNVGGAIADNEWHTLSVSFDRDGLMKMYEDGQFISETDISFIGDINTGQGLWMGTDFNSAYDFNGSISEVRVWNTILNPSEISDWNCTTIDNTHPNFVNLIGYWQLNEESGTIAVDASENENNGVISGATWNENDSIYLYNYDETPRIADAAVTALTHLCVEVPAPFEFDGISWVDFCETEGLDDLDKGSIKVHPNPIQNTIFLNSSTEESLSGYHFQIRTIKGELIKKGELGLQQEITVQHLDQGVYLIKISSPKNIKTGYVSKFIKS